jgi:hypothetical protein
VKVCMFHLMPYRDLPADFDKHYKSAYIDPVWFDVADPKKVGQYYNWTLDEFIHAARSGMNGVCTNQHHQNGRLLTHRGKSPCSRVLRCGRE